MFENPQKAQVVRIKIEAVSLDSTSMVPSLDGPLLRLQPNSPGASAAHKPVVDRGTRHCGRESANGFDETMPNQFHQAMNYRPSPCLRRHH